MHPLQQKEVNQMFCKLKTEFKYWLGFTSSAESMVHIHRSIMRSYACYKTFTSLFLLSCYITRKCYEWWFDRTLNVDTFRRFPALFRDPWKFLKVLKVPKKSLKIFEYCQRFMKIIKNPWRYPEIPEDPHRSFHVSLKSF